MIERPDCQADTTLRLVSASTSSVHGFNLQERKRKRGDINLVLDPGHVPLALVLQCSTSTSESSKRSSETVCTSSSAHVVDEECSMDLDLNFDLELNTETTILHKVPSVPASNPVSSKPVLDLRLSLSVSSITSEHESPAKNLISLEASTVNFPRLVIDDGAVSSCRKNGSGYGIPYGFSTESTYLLPHRRLASSKSDRVSSTSFSSILPEAPKSSVDYTSVNAEKQYRSNSTKNCQHPGCEKGARGASGRCIAHGGGRRCQKGGCQKGAEGKTIYCKAHGGGRRCEFLGCTKSAEGRTDLCIAHGGGRRCSKDGCTKAARGKSGLCIRHGGGKRCQKENCSKSAEGQSCLCIAHGGGKRCQFLECTKGAQGSTMFCKAHGGGKRCSFPECGKGAEGSTPFCKGHGGGKRCLFQGGNVCTKSVHGGTQFCVAHGGGKRCAAPECTKSARGRTDFCVRHGGGRRCQFDGCGKSAQGSTNFCKAHGGGKRCSWGEVGSDMGAGGPRCDKFARGKLGLCAPHLALLQDHQVHGGETIGFLSAVKALPAKADKMKGIVVEEGTNVMNWAKLDQPGMTPLPEGRVHGGSLMAFLASGDMLDHSANHDEGCSSTKSTQVPLYTMNYGNL